MRSARSFRAIVVNGALPAAVCWCAGDNRNVALCWSQREARWIADALNLTDTHEKMLRFAKVGMALSDSKRGAR